jgi:DNA-binding CsgD family transcriptional regulator
VCYCRPGVATGISGGSLVGRAAEVEAVELFLDRVSRGAHALVLEGEPGIGKTRVWTEGVRLARERERLVLLSRPAGTDAELAFAGLGDLLRDVLDVVVGDLPSPQRRALGAALLLEDGGGAVVDRHTVGAALLGALRLLSREHPVVLAVDDAQWLDPASRDTLAFALRRLDEEPVGLLATARLPPDANAQLMTALPDERVIRRRLSPLTVASLYEIVSDRYELRLSRGTLLRLHETSGGNPFYALEIARTLADAGTEPGPGEPLPVPADLRELVRARLAGLSPAAAEVVLTASALARPTVTVLGGAFPAADEALLEAASSGVVEVEGDTVRFSHPLLASIHYDASPRGQRRAIHERLAATVADPEERARHLALAAVGPDPMVAQMLADAANRSRRRGALSSAAELAELAANLTPRELPDLHGRLIVAAELYNSAGDPNRARALFDAALERATGGAARAETLLAAGLLAEQSDDPGGAARLYEEALAAAGEDIRLRSVALMHRSSVFGVDEPAVSERYAEEAVGLAERAGDARAKADALSMLGHLRYVRTGRVQTELCRRAIALEEELGAVSYEAGATEEYGQQLLDAWEIDAAREIFERLLASARAADDVAVTLPLRHLAHVEQIAGNLERAAQLAREATDVAAQGGRVAFEIWALFRLGEIEGLRGEVEPARDACRQSLQLAERTGGWTRGAQLALGYLESALEDYEAAWSYLDPANPRTGALGPDRPVVHVAEAVEVLVGLGRTEEARKLLEPFAERAAVLDRAWALAAAEHCQGLILALEGNLAGSEAAADEAVSLARAVPSPLLLGRALLALGTVQRRLRRKQAARTTLRDAQATFERIGATIWAARAEAELRRIGGRSAPAGSELSATEERIVQLAAAGHTNREIAEALSLSPKTVEWNLSKIYRKLGVRSRTQLAANR